jgi:hypothetical protein
VNKKMLTKIAVIGGVAVGGYFLYKKFFGAKKDGSAAPAAARPAGAVAPTVRKTVQPVVRRVAVRR